MTASKKVGITLVGSLLFPLAFTSAVSVLSVSCTGVPSTSAILWNASAQDGVAPYTFLWSNGATSTSQTVSATPGTYTTTVQATDASSTRATTTCNAAIVATSTPSGVAGQIKALLAQIETLKKQLAQLLLQQMTGGAGGAATSTPRGCFGFWRDLRFGDEGDDVRELQRELVKSDPTFFPAGLVTGYFGPKTFAALKIFQKRFEIDIEGSGFFGSKSRGHFVALCSRSDHDSDGIENFYDADDDNDGALDTSDKFPFNPNATSTQLKAKIKLEARDRWEHWKDWKKDKDDEDDDDD